MVNNAVLIRDCFRVDDGWSGAGVGHFPQPRLGIEGQRQVDESVTLPGGSCP